MMASVEGYLRRRRLQLRQWMQSGVVWTALQKGMYISGGFFLSAATLGWGPLPLAMALCAAIPGWRSVAAGVGGLLGSRLFWGSAELQGQVWPLLGTMLGLLPQRVRRDGESPWLVSGICAMLVAVVGLAFQLLTLETTSFGVYVLRAALAFVATALFCQRYRRKEMMLKWLCQGVLTLALAGVAPVKWLNFGDIACGVLLSRGPFPAAVLAAAAMELTQIHTLPLTAVVAAAGFLQRLPVKRNWLRIGAGPVTCLAVMALWGNWDWTPLPGLVLGALLGQGMPLSPTERKVSGRTGYIQVRLELTADILTQARQFLSQNKLPPVDEEALLEKARYRACSGCSARNLCAEQHRLCVAHLHQPEEFLCRKPARILGQLHRSREQLCVLRRERYRQEEYRWAVIQQYQYLSEHLRRLADRLNSREQGAGTHYRVRVAVRSRKKELVSGDRCTAFPGAEGRFYVALCDGMGTGMGAAREGLWAISLLRQMLEGGFSPEHTFRSINSMLVLQGQGGAVTLDLAEIHLDTGKTVLYKWGAAPSYLVTRRGIDVLGEGMPPPGLWVQEGRESRRLLTLRRGQSLVLLSDGAEEPLPGEILHPDMTAAEIAQTILQQGRVKNTDDATVAVVQLLPGKGTSGESGKV